MSGGKDECLELSAETAAALASFRAERAAAAAAAVDGAAAPSEDWQLSQFWYEEETATTLASEVASAAGAEGRVAFVSCPTALSAFLKRHSESPVSHVLLEYDERFRAAHPAQFVPYDYKEPLALPESLRGAFAVVILDPPFLSEECQVKMALTARWLGTPDAKILVCTGAVMEDAVQRLFHAKPTQFRPKHANNLANDFRCYANYQTNLPAS